MFSSHWETKSHSSTAPELPPGTDEKLDIERNYWKSQSYEKLYIEFVDYI